MTRVLIFIVALCAFASASCRNNANNVVLSSLNRSEKMQLFCADLEVQSGNRFAFNGLLPSVICTEDAVFESGTTPKILGAITQIQTGEVATINFTDAIIVNTSRTIPGVTPVTVGEQPTGIQISPFNSVYGYVTSFSPRTLQAISADELLGGVNARRDPEIPPPPPRQEIVFDVGPADVALHERAGTIILRDDEGRITGTIPRFDYRYLYVALPELGQVAQVPVMQDQTLGTPTFLQLDTYDCDSVTFVDPPVSDENDYSRICPQNAEEFDREGRYIKEVDTTTPCSEGFGAGPRPVAVTVDLGAEQGLGFGSPSGTTSLIDTGNDSDDVLLVADANQPVIHRFELGEGGATPLPPIVTGTPTTDVDSTPLVPKSSDPNDRAATERYLYAISGADGSVLVVDYTGTEASNPNFGAVLPAVAGMSARANEENIESRNRSRFEFSNVRAIEVVTPSYELDDSLQVPADDICTLSGGTSSVSTARNASYMRGVFLAVSLSNGTMFFLDIYDLNAPCRGGSEEDFACTIAETGADRFASIRRHRRRFSFTPSTYITVDGSPSLQLNTASGRLDEETGRPIGSEGPGLEVIECPESMLEPTDPNRASFGAVPGTKSGLICVSSQAWSSFGQRWDARWQGLIPSSEGGLGQFADTNAAGDRTGNWFQAGDVPFCRVGVLGRQDGAPVGDELSIDQLASYVGDRLVITGDPPPATRDLPQCQDFRNLKDDIDDRQVWFPIEEAYDDELLLGTSPNGGYSLAEVRACYTQLTEYQVHTRNVYTVVGTATGFIHRVIPEEGTNECILDPARPPVIDPDKTLEDVDTFLSGRAFPETQYINPLVSFRISDFGPDITPTDSTIAVLSFNVSNQFSSLVLPTGNSFRSLPGSALFSPGLDQLFFVDLDLGVQRIGFSPLSSLRSFE